MSQYQLLTAFPHFTATFPMLTGNFLDELMAASESYTLCCCMAKTEPFVTDVTPPHSAHMRTYHPSDRNRTGFGAGFESSSVHRCLNVALRGLSPPAGAAADSTEGAKFTFGSCLLLFFPFKLVWVEFSCLSLCGHALFR